MADIPQRYQPATGVTRPGSTSVSRPVQRTQSLDFGGLQSALDSWANRALERGERRARQSQRKQAVEAQAQAGTEKLAQPGDVALRFQEAFREQAIEHHSQQLELESRREFARLAREHHNDPDGFRAAADSYIEGVRGNLEEADPQYAEQAAQQLRSTAEGTAIQLADRHFSRQQAQRRQRVLSELEDYNAELQRELLNNPDEVRFNESLDSLEERTLRLQETGLLTAETAHSVLRNQRRSLTREYVRGQFRKDIEAGDFDGARATVESLRDGKWFQDNEDDRRLAGQLVREFEDATNNSQAGSTTASLRRLRQIERGALEGAEFDPEEAEEILRDVQRTGNPNQRAEALERFNGARLAAEIKPTVDTMDIDTAQATKENFAQMLSDGEISTRSYENLTQVIEDRQERVREKASAGRFVEVGGAIDWSQPAEEIARTARQRPVKAAQGLLARPSGDDPEAQEEYRRRVHQVANDMPLFSAQEMKKGQEQYRQAFERGDYERAAGLLEAMTTPYHNDPTRMAGELARAGDGAGEIYAAGILGQMGQAESVDRLLYYAGQGRSVQRDEGMRQQIENEVLDGDVEYLLNDQFSEEINAVAMGNADMRQSLRKFLRDSLYGRAAEVGEEGSMDPEQALQSWLGPLSETVEFTNGSKMPKAFLRTEDVEGARQAVNARIRNASKPVADGGLGITDETDREALQPAPMGNGWMGFRLRGRWVMNDEGTAPVTVGPKAELSGTSDEDSGTTHPPLVLDIKEVAQGAIQSATDWVNETVNRLSRYNEQAAVNRAGLAMDAPVAPLKATVQAIRDVAEASPDKLHGREGILGMSADADKRVDWDRVMQEYKKQKGWGASASARRTVQDASIAPYAAADLMRQARKAYPNNLRAQLAAFYEGPDAVEMARETAGDKWFTALPQDSQAVIRRIERYVNDG